MVKSEQRSSLSDTDMYAKSAHLLKASGIKVDSSTGVKFIIPPNLENMIEKVFGFSAKHLSVGGNLSLPDLAIHCDEQAGVEFHVSGLAEYYRLLLKQEEDSFDIWYTQTFYKCRTYLVNKGDKGVTEKSITGRLMIKYGKEYRERRDRLNTMEFEYRLLNNVVRSSVITKGTMLPTLRNIIQGRGDGIDTMFKGNTDLRKAIKVKVGNKNGDCKKTTEKSGK